MEELDDFLPAKQHKVWLRVEGAIKTGNTTILKAGSCTP